MLLQIKACYFFQLQLLHHSPQQMEFACFSFFSEGFTTQLRLKLPTPQQPLLPLWSDSITADELQAAANHCVDLRFFFCHVETSQAHLFLFQHFIMGCRKGQLFWVLHNISHATLHTIFETYMHCASPWSFFFSILHYNVVLGCFFSPQLDHCWSSPSAANFCLNQTNLRWFVPNVYYVIMAACLGLLCALCVSVCVCLCVGGATCWTSGKCVINVPVRDLNQLLAMYPSRLIYPVLIKSWRFNRKRQCFCSLPRPIGQVCCWGHGFAVHRAEALQENMVLYFFPVS